MLKRNKLACLLIIPLLFTYPTTSNSKLFHNQAKTENNIDLNEIVTIDNIGMLVSPICKQLNEQIRIAEEKVEIERQNKLKQIEEQKKQDEIKKEFIDFDLTFYTFKECKGGINAVTCHGDKPYQGIVASNIYPQGTKIHLENWGTVLVWDRGGSNFSNSNRLDVFLEPMEGESLDDCSKRAFELGHVFTQGYIIE